MIKEIFMASAMIMNRRTTFGVLASLVEEVGELSQEVAIINGASYKEPGEDGVVGEAIDVILCAVDLIRVYDAKITEDDIMEILKIKLSKWKSKSLEHMMKHCLKTKPDREIESKTNLMPPPQVEQKDWLDLEQLWQRQKTQSSIVKKELQHD